MSHIVGGVARGLLFASLLVAAVTPADARQQMPVADLYRAYAAGSPDEVSRALGNARGYQASRTAFRRLIEGWRRPTPGAAASVWMPSHVGFVLEVAGVVKGFDATEAVSILDSMRDLVALRAVPDPGKGGTLGPNDRFELAVHRVAVTLLCDSPKAASEYLDHISGRIDALRQLGGAEFVAPLMLARAVVADVWTLTFPSGTRPAEAGTAASAATVNRTLEFMLGNQREKAFEAASRAYTDAARLASVAAEANVRQGFLLFRWGRLRDALVAIDRGLAAAADDTALRYLGLLVRGRTLLALGRTSEAQQSYERAAEVIPNAQTAATALAALLVTQGQGVDAATWAARARAPDTRASDPWLIYWLGDARFGDVLSRQIREARP